MPKCVPEKATHIETSMGDFTEKTEVLKKTMAEIADSINTIAHAIEEGVKGVSSAADSTQVLVGDMEDITRHMDENQHIAADLKRETEVFKNYRHRICPLARSIKLLYNSLWSCHKTKDSHRLLLFRKETAP